ncbi:double-stranded RNA-binding protein 1-like [Punica granatum]|uniref:DRBM domain-containing protein n=2 Tax=Punica granatum TaxID=22663 RepID=A0A218WGI6_PUNGR|nr:double-stranded RNA-binding protein 1-like [Punica granatum]OWM71341.1 hypothetical protein CDL15_Pgr011470 [Punica granatum]PKI73106.1 hypothetical protein CRG98_006514 [Punica granatum]
MANNDGFSGVSKCYVFKSRLQEYAQKAGLPTPVYETIKEGPSHEPSFRSAVIVNDVRYNSLPGFFSRKAAEQSAAEVALLELSKSGEVSECISQPVHETGLCKNLLQEYAQKMNYAIPLYTCQRDELSGRRTLFTCTVEIGGIRYIGAAAGTKKEAEIKAARTALIAIQSSASEPSERQLVGESQLTVLPCKKRGPETASASVSTDAENYPKPKKPRIKKKASKRKPPRNNSEHNQVDSKSAEAEASTFPVRQLDNTENTDSEFGEGNGSSLPIGIKDPMRYPQLGGSSFISSEIESAGARFYQHGANGSQYSSSIIVLVNHDAPVTGMSSTEYGDITAFLTEGKDESRAGEVGSLSENHSHASNLETSSTIILTGFNNREKESKMVQTRG